MDTSVARSFPFFTGTGIGQQKCLALEPSSVVVKLSFLFNNGVRGRPGWGVPFSACESLLGKSLTSPTLYFLISRVDITTLTSQNCCEMK